MGKIIYVADECYTSNERGSTGSIGDTLIFQSLADAYEYIITQYKATNEGKCDGFFERQFKRPDGSEYLVSSLNYTTEWDDDDVCWEITEFDLEKDIK